MVSPPAIAPWLNTLERDFREIARYDHSVAVPNLGTLFRDDPHSAIGAAQRHLAAIYGVPFAYPSTNGTSMLNVLALMTVTGPGDTVLIQRDSHVSVFAALIHLGLRPVYVAPRYAPDIGVPLGITPAHLRRSLHDHPDVRAIFLTYPNYFGIATDLHGCAAVAREYGVPLIVDAAHGAHFAFHPDLPTPAEQTSAAIVTQSTHKTCGALGQSSVALFNDESLIERFYEMVNHLGFVSTSFSSIILMTLFQSVLALHERGTAAIAERLAMAAWAREAINAIDGLCCFGPEAYQEGFIAFDPLRITVNVAQLGRTGFAVERALYRSGHYPEFATLDNVLFLATLGTEWEEIEHLVASLRAIAAAPRAVRSVAPLPFPAQPRQVMDPRAVFFSRHRRRLSADEAVGKVSAETIATYPPGAAVIVAGEEVTAEIVAFLRAVRGDGGVLKGASDADLATIIVLGEE
jgi:arginine decarboxylase